MQTPQPSQNIKQELINSIIHGFGIIFGIVSIPLLIALAVKSDHTAGVIGAAIYGFCFLQLFTFSTLYHGFQNPQAKRVLEVLDHISIYFLISGTYTPFILIYLNNTFGIVLLSILWGLTSVGIVFKIFFTGRWNILSTFIYVVMGLILFVGGDLFFNNIPWSVRIMIFIGGGLYLLGVIFYLCETCSFNHAIWHFFVLSAAICHYVAILIAI